jgi:hypothetical protein
METGDIRVPTAIATDIPQKIAADYERKYPFKTPEHVSRAKVFELFNLFFSQRLHAVSCCDEGLVDGLPFAFVLISKGRPELGCRLI